MSLIARIQDELKDAMRDRDNDRRDALRLILSSLQSAEKELQRPLNDQEELQVLQRERKKRVEAEEAFRTAGRVEQADAEGFAKGAEQQSRNQWDDKDGPRRARRSATAQPKTSNR